MPWLRLDALMLLLVWYLAYWNPPRNQVKQAWIVAATFLPVSFGWAAGDVSLAAYIQASLARKESEHQDVSALGTVMAFLYSTYIVLYAILQPLLGKHIDAIFTRTGGTSGGGRVNEAIRNVAGVQFTVVSITILAATFIPKGALSLNPKALYGENLAKEIEADEADSEGGSSDAYQFEKTEEFSVSPEIAVPGGRNSVVGTLQPMNNTRETAL
jgi:MFS family permease